VSSESFERDLEQKIQENTPKKAEKISTNIDTGESKDREHERYVIKIPSKTRLETIHELKSFLL